VFNFLNKILNLSFWLIFISLDFHKFVKNDIFLFEIKYYNLCKY